MWFFSDFPVVLLYDHRKNKLTYSFFLENTVTFSTRVMRSC